MSFLEDDIHSYISSVDDDSKPFMTSMIPQKAQSERPQPQVKVQSQQQERQQIRRSSPLQRKDVVEESVISSTTSTNETNQEMTTELKEKLETKRREKVEEWVETLKEPLEKELEAFDKEEDLAEDSFGSLDIPLSTTALGSPTKSGKSKGQLSTYVYVVRIQSRVRMYQACKLVARIREERKMLRDDIKNSCVMGSSLADTYNKLLQREEELMENSFGSNLSAPVDDSIEGDAAQLEIAVSNYEGARVDHEIASKQLDREIHREALREQKRLEEERERLRKEELLEKEKAEREKLREEQELLQKEEAKRERLRKEQEEAHSREEDKRKARRDAGNEYKRRQDQNDEKEENSRGNVEIDDYVEGILPYTFLPID